MGYMLTGSNFNNKQFDDMEASHAYGSTVPDAVLVKKHWPNRRRNRRRHWRLRRMAKDEGELLPKKSEQERAEAEYELFLRDVEEDEELRAAVALYKNTSTKGRKPKAQEMEVDGESVAETEDMDDDDAPKVNMEELLEDFDELDIQDEEG